MKDKTEKEVVPDIPDAKPVKPADAAKKQTAYHVPALEKGLDLLETLSLTHQPVSLAELSRQLDRSSSELFRMVDCLERRGYIVKESHSGNYSLSLKLYELSHTHSPVDKLLKAAEKPMRELAGDVRESCHISVVSQGKLLVLAQADSPEKVRISMEVGAAFPLVHTASGRLLLAAMEPERLEAILRSDPDYLELDESEQGRLRGELAQISRTGFSAAEDETHIGIKDLAVLVGNPHTGPTAALAIGYITKRRREQGKELLTALRTCSNAINEALGLLPVQAGREQQRGGL